MKKNQTKNNHFFSKITCQKDKIRNSLFEVENFLDTFKGINDIFKISKVIKKKRY